MDQSLRWPYGTFAQAENEGVITGFQGDYRWLSNFEGKVTAYGLAFGSVEAAFVASKLTPPGKATEAEGKQAVEALAAFLGKPALLRADAPRGPTWLAIETIAGLPANVAKKAGTRKAGLPLRADWEETRPDGLLVKEWTLLTLNRRKYDANPDLAKKLLATEGKLILEGNAWGDRTWGVIETQTGLQGYNGMGCIAMSVREERGGRGIPADVPAKAPRYTGRGLDAAAPTPSAKPKAKTRDDEER